MAFDVVSKVSLAGGSVDEPYEGTTTITYAEVSFKQRMDTITVSNDSATDTLHWSYDGATLGGRLKPNESITIQTSRKASVFVRGVAGGGEYRIWAW